MSAGPFLFAPRLEIAAVRARLARLEELRDELANFLPEGTAGHAQVLAPLNRIIRRLQLELAKRERAAWVVEVVAP